jgi:hypothetical protein
VVLSFLEHGGGYDPEDAGGKPMIVVSKLALLLVGVGQFIAALRKATRLRFGEGFSEKKPEGALYPGRGPGLPHRGERKTTKPLGAKDTSMNDSENPQFGIKTTVGGGTVDDFIRFQCAGCGKTLKAKPQLAEWRVRCSCGQAMRVPVVDGEDDNGGQLPEALPALPRAGLKSTSVLAPLVLPPRPPACWNVISVFAPFVGLLCAFLVGGLMAGGWDRMWWMAGLAFGFGLLSGLIALARGERLIGITALGLFLNLIPFLYLHSLFLY